MRLSDLLGRPVVGPDGARLGVLADLVASLDDPHPVATALLVRRRRTLSRAPWESVDALGPGRVELNAAPAPDGDSGAGELRLARDVLDTQIVDLGGRRVVRVGDVELAARGRALHVVAVDASLAAVLRRLGLGRIVRGGRHDAIDWRDVHIASGRGHAVQLASAAAAVHRVDAHELATIVAALPGRRGEELLTRIGGERAAAARTIVQHRRRRFPHRRRRHAPT